MILHAILQASGSVGSVPGLFMVGVLLFSFYRQRNSKPADRRYFVGGSDARIIIGDDEAALPRLWREKRGEVEPEDLSDNLIRPARPVQASICGL